MSNPVRYSLENLSTDESSAEASWTQSVDRLQQCYNRLTDVIEAYERTPMAETGDQFTVKKLVQLQEHVLSTLTNLSSQASPSSWSGAPPSVTSRLLQLNSHTAVLGELCQQVETVLASLPFRR